MNFQTIQKYFSFPIILRIDQIHNYEIYIHEKFILVRNNIITLLTLLQYFEITFRTRNRLKKIFLYHKKKKSKKIFRAQISRHHVALFVRNNFFFWFLFFLKNFFFCFIFFDRFNFQPNIKRLKNEA